MTPEEMSNRLNEIYLAITNKTDYQCSLSEIRSSMRLRFLLSKFLENCEERAGNILVEIKKGIPKLIS